MTLATTTSAEDSGLICGYFFEPGEPSREVTLADLEGLLSQGSRECFAWVHLNLTHMAAQRWLDRGDGITPAFREALQDQLRVSRLECDDEVLIAVLNDVRFNFSYDASQTATLWAQVDRRLVVTARQAPLRSVDRLRHAIRRGRPVHSTIELLEILLREQAGVLVQIVRHLTLEVDQAEDDLLGGRPQVKRAVLGAQRRLLVRLQRLLAPEPASLFRLLQHPPDWISDAAIHQLRSASEEFSAVLQELAALQERIKLVQEELSAVLNERTSRSLFVLTVVTVLALPINILAGLFGMNVGGVPLAHNEHGFWLIVLLVVSFTAVAAFWLLRRNRTD